MGTYQWTAYSSKPRLRMRYGYWLCGVPDEVWVVGLTAADAYAAWERLHAV